MEKDIEPQDKIIWEEYAACKEYPTSLFFPVRDEAKEREAKSVCESCPVQDECLEYAIANREEFGVWGGATEKERRTIVRRRARIAALGNAVMDAS